MSGPANLNASRGNRLGIGIFRLLLKCGGLRPAFWLARFVTWFYAAFDRRAFAATAQYLHLRFPEDAADPRRLRRHFHRLLAELAKMLIVAHWTGSGRQLPLAEIDAERLPAEGGVVVVLAHCDCWQAAMPFLNTRSGRKINIMAQPDQGELDKYLAFGDRRDFAVISTEGFSGGLLEASAALARGEAVIVMGDRPVPGTATAEAPYFGGKLAVPLSPWLLAARNDVPAVAAFTEWHDDPPRIDIRYCEPFVFPPSGGGRVRPDMLMPGVERYVRELEDFARRSPYRVFRFGGETEKEK